MDGTATARKFEFRRFWKRYGGAILVFGCTLGILAFYAYIPPRAATSISNFLRPYRGGPGADLTIAYVGLAMVVAAQGYTLVKRIGVPEYIRKLGGSGRWLTVHIGLSLGGLIGILVHAGFPFQFPYRSLTIFGYAGIATWLLMFTTISGVFGRYLYKHLPAMKRAFAIWRPTHVVETALFFLFTFLHIWSVTSGGG